MTKAAAKGPKASIQYVRSMRKSLDRAWSRIRDSSAEIRALWEVVHDLLALTDPEIVSSLPTLEQHLIAAQEEE